MSVFGSMDISSSGLTAQRLRMDVISQNIANVNTTRDENGNVYRRKSVVFAEKDITCFSDALSRASGTVGDGVKVVEIVEDTNTELKKVYDPSHPDADEEGYVSYPNVNTVTEMTDLIDASRAYEANITAFNAAKNLAVQTLQMGK
ncbi:flagellar basal body rod protein FlgC [Anaeromicropila populeti]|uniref:Flagellar basal-body rod protein FlgC n=1 Tax=Anaeromicropila populeti TaxID=37658 RepID=A0A1I6KX59_9FIRM|nr:flagellar basal body rod protein FlgC [Anaeromicropila populeti]SFR95806.1 flagellar basal-body rod protein FlgC [Anaeromicropila populeti]